MKVKLSVISNFCKGLHKTWKEGDLSKKINIGLGIASVLAAPIGAIGVWSAEALQDDKSKIDLNSFKGKLFKMSAFAYPIVWTFIQGIIGLGQGIMSGSLLTTFNGVLALVSTFFYDFLMYKILGFKTKIKELQKEDPIYPNLDELKQKANKYLAWLNFYTSIYITLFSFTGEFSATPDLSPDVGKKLQIKPLESESFLTNPHKFFERAKFNFKQEIKASKQALRKTINPFKWRSAEGVQKFIQEKNIKWPLASLVKICSSPMPSALAILSASARLLAGVLFLSTFPFVGLNAYKDDLQSEEKQKLKTEHPIAQKAFDFANLLKSVVMWCTGLMSITMAFSRSYKQFASEFASILQGLAGLVSIGAGIAQGPLTRLLTFMSSISITFANGIRNLEGARK